MKVLFLGGTGIISTSCVADALAQNFDIYVLNLRSMYDYCLLDT